MSRLVRKFLVLLEMIKFEHTVFAMPFALTGAFLAANGFPAWGVIGWIMAAMVGARSSAMAFNRIVDARFDALNPRTAGRAIPKGLIGVSAAWAVTVLGAALMVLSARMLNPLAFYLSPLALLVVLGYSYTKRLTSFSHLVLGLALGIAPVGAWIAVRGRIEFAPILLSGAVVLWTAGFDIIYSLLDVDFDKKMGLFSIPKVLGTAKALAVSRVFHVFSVLLLFTFGLVLGLGWVYYLGVGIVACLLAYEQGLVKPEDLSKVNIAFFNLNGFVSIGFFCFSMVDLVMRKVSS